MRSETVAVGGTIKSFPLENQKKQIFVAKSTQKGNRLLVLPSGVTIS
jgi:hypothetical protein